MQVLLLEPYLGGHHTNYIEALVPTLCEYLRKGLLSRVTIAITSSHYAQLKTFGIVQPALQAGIVFDTSLMHVSPGPNLKERWQLFKELNRLVKLIQPDCVVVPSADYDVQINALLGFMAHFGQGTRVKAVGVFHYGQPKPLASGRAEYLKQCFYTFAWRFSNWNTMLMVNPIVLENVVQQDLLPGKALHLLPDPVPPKLQLSAENARSLLGLPASGCLLGFCGMMDSRKAIPEVLSAFDQIQHDVDATLVLIGQLAPDYKALIDARYQGLLASGRLILLNRFLTQQEVLIAYAALDIVTLLQYRRANLSANLLKAMMNDKPIIADDFGYTGMMLSRFALGYRCDVGDVDSIASAMRRAVATKDTFKPSAQVAKLKAFHSPTNFADMVMHNIVGDKVDIPVKTWDWVCRDKR